MPLVVGGGAVLDSRDCGVWGLSVFRGGALECLPKEVEPRPILSLGPLHADPVR